MTKEQLLKQMMTENQFKATHYYYMRLKKAIILQAYQLYNEVSHRKGLQYLYDAAFKK